MCAKTYKASSEVLQCHLVAIWAITLKWMLNFIVQLFWWDRILFSREDLDTAECGQNKYWLCVYVFVRVAGVPVSPRPHEAICLWGVTLQCRNSHMAFHTVWMAWVLSCTASTACQSQGNTSYRGMMTPHRRPVTCFLGVTAPRHRLSAVSVMLSWRTRRFTPLKRRAMPSPPCTATSVQLTIMTFPQHLAPSTRSPGRLIRITMPWHPPALSPPVRLLPGPLNLASRRGSGGVLTL